MFIGHFAVGLASKRLAPRASLGALVCAPLLLDLVWPVFLLTGVEHVRIDPGNTAVTPLDFFDYPWTHSLLGALGWSLAFAGVFWMARKDARTSVVLGLGVFSHWVLDFVTHRPDLPLAPGSAVVVGLGLWRSRAATIVVEASLFALGVWLYARATSARDRVGRWALFAFAAVLSLIYVANLFGPPPPSVTAIAWSAMGVWLFVAWAAWIDRHRAPKS